MYRYKYRIHLSKEFLILHPHLRSKRKDKIYIYVRKNIRKKYSHGGEVVHHGVMVNLYEGLIVAVEVSPRSEPTYRNQHIPVPVIRVPLFPFRYNFPPPRRSPWVTSREHFGGPLSPPRINLWPRKREGDCLCSHALGGLPTTFLRVLHCLDSKRTLPIFGEREGLRLSLSLRLIL